MRISKSLLVFCAALAGMLVSTTWAAENEAQTKAKQALQDTLGTESSAPASTLQPLPQPGELIKIKADPKAQARAQSVLRQAYMEELAQTAPAADAAAQAKSQEALRQEMANLRAQQASAEQTRKEAEAAAQQRAAQEKQAAAGQQRQADMAAKEKAAQPAPVVAKTTTAKPVAPAKPDGKKAPAQAAPQADAGKTAAKTGAKTEVKTGPESLEPLASPGSPLTGNKEQALRELLKKYAADEIAPEDYHKERARILAQ